MTMLRFRYYKAAFALSFVLLMPLLLFAKPRKESTETIEDILPVASQWLSPSGWQQGMPFVFLRDDIGMSLTPEVPESFKDTLAVKGGIWHYDSMVSEEDWMGQELLQLRFLSPTGKAYRFSTGRPMSSALDPNYQPVIGCLYPLQLIQQVDSVLRAQTLYILLNDERVQYMADTVVGLKHEKFVPVVIDSVTSGNELAPVAVHFHREKPDGGSEAGSFLASLPGSRETGTSTSLSRFLSLSDPYLLHPDIEPAIWNLIKQNSVRLDMTAEEVRLALGRPLKVEKGASRTGMVELWFYGNNQVLQIWDGRLYKVGIL